LLEALSFSVDRDETARLWAEYEVVLNEEHPFTFFYFPDRLTGVNKRVRGVHMDARGEWTNLKDWYLDPERR
jgi:ABC-type transport system substrate-binding protein